MRPPRLQALHVCLMHLSHVLQLVLVFPFSRLREKAQGPAMAWWYSFIR